MRATPSRPSRPWIEALPKAELHIHLEGSTPADFAAQLAKQKRIDIPGLIHGPETEPRYAITDFRDFVRCYIALSKCLQDTQDFYELSLAVAADLAKQHIRYAEVTFTPMTHLARGLSAQAVFEGLIQASQEARKRYGLHLAWVMDIVRSLPETATGTLDFARQARHAGLDVVALGIGGPEGEAWPGDALAPIFQQAKAESFASVPHAGEQHDARGVWEALHLFHPLRIGHGIRAVEDPKLLQTLAERDICLEICPNSNLRLTSLPNREKHPLPMIEKANIPWTLASDDPGLFHFNLVDEYQHGAQCWGWDRQKLGNIARQSFLRSLAPKKQIAAYLQELEQYLELTPAAPNPAPPQIDR